MTHVRHEGLQLSHKYSILSLHLSQSTSGLTIPDHGGRHRDGGERCPLTRYTMVSLQVVTFDPAQIKQLEICHGFKGQQLHIEPIFCTF